MTGPAASPFNPRAVLAMLLIGGIAFVAMLYLAGAGALGGDPNDGGGHAGAKGLNGFAGFAQLLEQRGYRVSLSRNDGRLEGPGLLVLTPPPDTRIDQLNRIIERRRYAGPTLVILPKWFALPLPKRSDVKARPGWVSLLAAPPPVWAADLLGDKAMKLTAAKLDPGARYWDGMGLTGSLPDPDHVVWAQSNWLVPLVRDGAGDTLAGYWNDDGVYPALDAAADVSPADDARLDRNLWPVVVVVEPDLVDNYGLADRNRAMLSLAIADAAMMGRHDLPVTFDLTLDGLGASKNLLTLAFTPPFLAATLCLALAALVIGWRAWRRFGPPIAEAPAFAFGKRQLAANGAALIQRSRRLHLLAAPYAAILRGRVAHALGLRAGDSAERTEAEIDSLLEARGLPPRAFSGSAETLRHARGSHELLRSAQALKQLERSLS